MRHFDNLAYAFLDPKNPIPNNYILQAADLGCGPDRVSLFPSSIGRRLGVFSSPFDRENAIQNGPFIVREAFVFFRRHDETDNHFISEHEVMAALSIGKYPWNIGSISTSPTPLCLTPILITSILSALGGLISPLLWSL
jgi:hypothetical protein